MLNVNVERWTLRTVQKFVLLAQVAQISTDFNNAWCPRSVASSFLVQIFPGKMEQFEPTVYGDDCAHPKSAPNLAGPRHFQILTLYHFHRLRRSLVCKLLDWYPVSIHFPTNFESHHLPI